MKRSEVLTKQEKSSLIEQEQKIKDFPLPNLQENKQIQISKKKTSGKCKDLSSHLLIQEMNDYFNTPAKVQTVEDIRHIKKDDGSTHILKFSKDPRGKKKLTHFKLAQDGFPIAQKLTQDQTYNPSLNFLKKLSSGKELPTLTKKTYQYSSMSFYIEIEDQKIKFLNLTNKDKSKVCKDLKNSPLFMTCACR